ncbi:MAG: Clp1/GlmU family protein [Sulfolobales archaeon]
MRSVLYLSKNSIVRVAGPASLKILSGKISILGKILSQGDSTTISLYRSYPIYSLEESSVEISLGEGGYVEYPKESDETTLEWFEVVDKIIERGSRIIVIGPTESGKTTFAALAVNKALAKGLKTCVVDADIGQQDIALPSFISLACPKEPVIWLRELFPDEIRIIGSLTPSQYSSRIIGAVIDLVDKAFSSGAEVIVINTDGWINHPSAIEMKLDLARYVRATHLIVLQRDQLIIPSNISLENMKIIRLSPPQNVRVRSREDRKTLRAYAYKKFFDGASLRQEDLSKILLIGSCLFSGEPLRPEMILELEKILGAKIDYGSVIENSIYLYVRQEKIPQDKQFFKFQGYEINVIQGGSERGLIVSILDKNLREVAPGILDEIRPSEKIIKILTKYTGEIGGVVIGRVKLDSAYDDSIRFTRCPI